MTSISKYSYYLIYFLTALTIFRLAVAPYVGLGVDEAHYVLYGYFLDLSYFDHPPLVGWTEFLSTSIFGINEFGARVPAILIGIITSISVYKLLLHVTQDEKVALFGVIALNSAFIFNALFLMLMPETLLFALIIPIIFTTIAIEKHNTFKDWLLLGLLLGLAGLAKYTAFLFVIAIIIYLLIKKRYSLFISPFIIPSIALAALMISPIIIWNSEHDWISFAFQAAHVAGESHIDWENFGASVGAQLGAYSPFLFPVAYFGLYKSLRSKNNLLFLSGIFALVLISFFTYASLYNRALPHWTALFYLLMIPVGSAFLFQMLNRWHRYIKYSVIFSFVISMILYFELLFKFIPLPDYQSLHRDIYGFDTIMKEANALIQDNQAIAVTNWSLASRALYYNLPYTSDIFLIDTRNDQFDIWQKKSPLGRDLIFIDTHDFKSKVETKMDCLHVKKLKSIDIILNENKVNTIDYHLCSHFQGIKK
ncbi:MAG: glycosyltransferase family 39 protein [Campylobacterota bacterium]|nr:glycosyltransferase family 39 protein [Campylobacterota bacterium]